MIAGPMSLSDVDTWTLVAGGLVAHADERLEGQEWGHLVALLEVEDADATLDTWLERLMDAEQLEAAFAKLPPLPAAADRERVLYRAWQVALSDGEASEVEASVHQRVAERLGVPAQQAEAWRAEWSRLAARRAELAVGIAAWLANLDGRLDAAEASQFTDLLERAPISVGRRLDLGEQLHAPPDLDDVVAQVVALPEDERLAVLRDLAPMVHASARGEQERAAYLQIARRFQVDEARALALLEA